jgi:required for meiotic nuclear division protein 1
MAETVKLTAFLVANQLDIKGIKSFLDIKPLADSSSELFYGLGPAKFQQFFNYGVIVFSGYSEEEMKWGIKAINGFQKNPLAAWLRDEFQIRIDEGKEQIFEFNEVVVGRCDEKVIRIAMLNLAQSVALDYSGLLSRRWREPSHRS